MFWDGDGLEEFDMLSPLLNYQTKTDCEHRREAERARAEAERADRLA